MILLDRCLVKPDLIPGVDGVALDLVGPGDVELQPGPVTSGLNEDEAMMMGQAGRLLSAILEAPVVEEEPPVNQVRFPLY